VSSTLNIGELLNIVGLSAGVVLYAMLLAMVVRGGRTGGVRAPIDPLLLLTSLLGLVWNVCAVPVYEFTKVGIEGPFPWLAACGFAALGFLPAVVVHSVLRGPQHRVAGRARQAIAAAAYSASFVAAALHVRAAFTAGTVPSGAAMRLLTYVFLALVLPLATVTRRQPGSRRALWAAALAIFAVSAMHLSQLHRGDASWPVELVGHHASVPLALAILYQDYPFALADLFLRRALSLVALVGLTFASVAIFAEYSSEFAAFVRSDPGEVGVLVTLWAATALLYPALRRASAWFVDAVVLDRPDYRQLRASIAHDAAAHDSPASLLSDVCERLAPALSAGRVAWRESAAPEAAPTPGAAVTVVPVPVTEAPRYAIVVSDLTGGRRLLSDDLAALEAIAAIAARRIDGIRLAAERYERASREREIAQLATEAELRALRAQINPHFLFNALTTLGYLIQTAPPRALQTLMRLTSLLRALLRSEGDFTTLGHELDVVESYLDIERARFEQRLRVTIDVSPKLRHVRVPPLILQPLVENAVKHGIAQKQAGGDVIVRARIRPRPDGAHARDLELTIHDTGSGSTPEALARGRAAGVGLQNVERRLACQYGRAASLDVRSTPGIGTTVEVRLPVETPRSEPAVPA
jgi:two-component system LytT family sensor kinase